MKLHVSMRDWECIFLRHRRYGFFEMYFARTVGDACARALLEVKRLIRDARPVFETLRGAPGAFSVVPTKFLEQKVRFHHRGSMAFVDLRRTAKLKESLGVAAVRQCDIIY